MATTQLCFIACLFRSVFIASLKMSVFYGLYTWMTHLLFGVQIVFIPSGMADITTTTPTTATLFARSEIVFCMHNCSFYCYWLQLRLFYTLSPGIELFTAPGVKLMME